MKFLFTKTRVLTIEEVSEILIRLFSLINFGLYLLSVKTPPLYFPLTVFVSLGKNIDDSFFTKVYLIFSVVVFSIFVISVTTLHKRKKIFVSFRIIANIAIAADVLLIVFGFKPGKYLESLRPHWNSWIAIFFDALYFLMLFRSIKGRFKTTEKVSGI